MCICLAIAEMRLGVPFSICVLNTGAPSQPDAVRARSNFYPYQQMTKIDG